MSFFVLDATQKGSVVVWPNGAMKAGPMKLRQEASPESFVRRGLKLRKDFLVQLVMKEMMYWISSGRFSVAASAVFYQAEAIRAS